MNIIGAVAGTRQTIQILARGDRANSLMASHWSIVTGNTLSLVNRDNTPIPRVVLSSCLLDNCPEKFRIIHRTHGTCSLFSYLFSWVSCDSLRLSWIFVTRGIVPNLWLACLSNSFPSQDEQLGSGMARGAGQCFCDLTLHYIVLASYYPRWKCCGEITISERSRT